MDNIKCCPICGDSGNFKGKYIHGVANKKAYWISCNSCRFRTQDRNRPEKAIKEWNNYGVEGRSIQEQIKFINTRYEITI